MYSPPAFVVDDLAVLHEIVRNKVFVTMAAIVEGAVKFAYAPVVVDAKAAPRGALRFHLAAANPLAKLAAGARVAMTVNAADAYVSPDWYKKTHTVPTWNYVAVEGEGALHRTSRDELRKIVIDLSAQEEEKLLPKTPWLIGKLPEARVEGLINGIAGFSLTLDRLQGKFKLSQDKTPEDIAGVIAALEARGDAASVVIAKAMRATAP